ncbi:hypothetical protein JXA88_09010 [Candidatus Fermentibacteria bacterium]|nr:hypothetical protein [Candidatus Fermentibacteria bacterium]
MFRRTIPTILAFVVGVFMIVQFFVPHPVLQTLYNMVLDWKQVVFGCVLIVGTLTLVRHHAVRIRFRKQGYGYSVIALVSLFAMVLAGAVWGIEKGPYPWLFDYVQIPGQATMFSLLGFFIATAAYRSFRARNVTATLLLLSGVIVMLGRVPAGEHIAVAGVSLSDLATWILDYPNNAAKRGILIGVGLGMTSTALKIIIGIERSYLGKGD